MSSGQTDEAWRRPPGDLVRELRRFGGLGATLLRTVAGRADLNPTDLQVIDLLLTGGSMAAGQLAELTGLTTGAMAQLLGRLEKDGLVRRERDPADGRRVLVRLGPGWDATGQIAPTFEAIGRAWEEVASRYDDEQRAVLLEFLAGVNAVSGEAIAASREVPAAEAAGVLSAPLGIVGSGRLVVAAGAATLVVRADAAMADLYRTSFEGPAPEVRAEEGSVTLRYPRRLVLFGKPRRAAEVTLNATIPWQIAIRGGAADITAELGWLDLAGLEVDGGASMVRLDLPEPSGTVRVKVTAGASAVVIRRPLGVAARVSLKGWASAFTFDDQHFVDTATDTRVQSPGYDATTRRYDIVVSGSGSQFTVTAG